MTYKNLSPNLRVKNVKQSVEYYTQILGFDLIATVPETNEDEWVFAIIKSGGIMFMFQEEKSLLEEYPQLSKHTQGGALTFYIHVSDVHLLYQKISNKVTIAKEIHDTFYGSTDFAIEDCNGFILVFSQDKNEKL